MFRGIKNIDELLKKADFGSVSKLPYMGDKILPSKDIDTNSSEIELSSPIGDGMDHKKPENENWNSYISKKNGNPEVTLDKSNVE